MKRFLVRSIIACAGALCINVLATQAVAITTLMNAGVETNGMNRPFFPAGTAGRDNPAGISGTAEPQVDSVSFVTGTGLQIGGNSSLVDLSDGNGIPMGVRVVYDLSFTVETTGQDHTLSDGGNMGLGVFSPGETGNPPNRLSAGEQLLFTDLSINNVSVIDPLGLLQPGTTASNPVWRAIRSQDFGGAARASVSSDADVTQNVTNFGGEGNPVIADNLASGSFPPMSEIYLTIDAGQWRLKEIGYAAELDFELAPQPVARRTFHLAENPPELGAYDLQPTHVRSDHYRGDTTINLEAFCDPAWCPPGSPEPTVLNTNTLGVGVRSQSDIDAGVSDAAARRIAGDRGEAIHFSFDRDVSLESLTAGNLGLGEEIVVSFVSGVNPFTGLTGYSGNYTLGSDFISFTYTDAKEDPPFLVPYGMGGQDEIIVEAGTVLALTSGGAVTFNGILLNMITVNLLEIPTLDGDFNGDGVVDAADYTVWRDTDGTPDNYNLWRLNFGATLGLGSGATFKDANFSAVPEPSAAALLLLAAAGIIATIHRSGRQRRGTSAASGS